MFKYLIAFIASCSIALAAPSAAVRQGPENRPIPGMVVLDTDGFTTQMLTRVIVFYAYDGATTAPMTMTKLNQAMKWPAPLSGRRYAISVTVAGVAQPQSWVAEVPDILTLYYPDADIPQLAADGRDMDLERLYCAKRYNRQIAQQIAQAQAALARLQQTAKIDIPAGRVEDRP